MAPISMVSAGVVLFKAFVRGKTEMDVHRFKNKGLKRVAPCL